MNIIWREIAMRTMENLSHCSLMMLNLLWIFIAIRTERIWFYESKNICLLVHLDTSTLDHNFVAAFFTTTYMCLTQFCTATPLCYELYFSLIVCLTSGTFQSNMHESCWSTHPMSCGGGSNANISGFVESCHIWLTASSGHSVPFTIVILSLTTSQVVYLMPLL